LDVFSVSSRRFSERLETLDKQQQTDSSECKPPNDMEAIQKRQKTYLMLQIAGIDSRSPQVDASGPENPFVTR
jgi:hypothetical protein